VNDAQLTQRKFYILLLAWGLFLVLFLWSLSPILGPLILFFILVYLLAPFYGTRLYGRIVTSLGFLTALWLVWSAGFILTPFVLALVLAYILDPLVDRAQREGLGRTAATALVLVTFVLLLVMAGILLGPLLSTQVANFVSKLPEFLEGALVWLQRLVDRISHIPLPGMRRMELGEALNIDTANVSDYLASQSEAIRRGLVSGAIGVGKGLGVVLTVVSYLLITPILTFFLLRDFDKVVAGAGKLVPPQRRPRTFAFFREFDVLLGRFLRSQLLVSVLVGIVIGVGFWIAGFPYALLLGVIAGVFNIIPYLGLVLSLVPAVLIALVSGDVGGDLLKVAAVFGVEQVLENFFSPRIVGQSVGLHPVWVLLAIVLFSFFFGFIGLLIAVPAAVAIKLMLSNLMRFYEESTYYRGSEPLEGGEPLGAGGERPAAKGDA
jgi:predicted PurR-regulated permease PerM